MLVHYCGDPGACNNNEAKNLPSPLSSHPLYPKLRGLAAVWRGCCSCFSSSCSHVPCIFLFSLPFGSSVGAHSAQTLSRPSSIPQSGRERNLLSTISFLLFLFSLHEKVLMEPRVGFCFQADSFAMFCFANGGKVFGGGCESSFRGSLALSCSIPPSTLGQDDRECQAGLCTAQGVSLPRHSHRTWEVLL